MLTVWRTESATTVLRIEMNPQIEWSAQQLAQAVQHDVRKALDEDVGTGDLTAALIAPDTQAHARVLARESAVICGRPWVEATLQAIDPNVEVVWHVAEGQRCAPNTVVLELWGKAQSILTAERTVLNFMQTLSAVATKVAVYVARVAGTRAQIVDTRKTLPGLRMAQKYAVTVGGGANHRMGLYDAVLIKENHIAAAGGVRAVLAQVNAQAPQARFVQIEVETLPQLQEALEAGARMVLLDNMDIPTLQQAVAMNAEFAKTHGQGAVLEISGGVNLDTVADLAQTGVDRISIGALTKDVQAIDFSMRFDTL